MLRNSDCNLAGLDTRIGALIVFVLGIVTRVALMEPQRTVCTRIDMSILSSQLRTISDDQMLHNPVSNLYKIVSPQGPQCASHMGVFNCGSPKAAQSNPK